MCYSSLCSVCTEPFPPPTDVQLVEANHTHLSFNWSLVLLNCPSIFYHIVASNCGQCPDTTTSNKVICTGNYAMISHQCSFAVQASACNDSTVGDISTAVNVTVNRLSIRSTKLNDKLSPKDSTMCAKGLY